MTDFERWMKQHAVPLAWVGVACVIQSFVFLVVDYDWYAAWVAFPIIGGVFLIDNWIDQ